MPKQSPSRTKTRSTRKKKTTVLNGELSLVVLFVVIAGLFAYAAFSPLKYDSQNFITGTTTTTETAPPPPPTLDKKDYDARLTALANNPPPPPAATSTASSSGTSTATVTPPEKPDYLWPAKGNPYPNYGAILPFYRIVAYYGNFYSTNMGILGEFSEDVVLSKLKDEVSKWSAADPSTPVMPAIEYIAVTAQASAGDDNNYNARMPFDQIDHAIEMANKVNGIVILDVQAGTGNLLQEVKLLEPYLKQPKVHLAIDPEFNMKYGHKPGTYIGTVDASDVNAISDYLASLVNEYDLPPKILVVHRFTAAMVTNAENIKPLPEVQIVMDMDGWGSKAKKKNTYQRVIYSEPVQFTGFKIFYKNDLKPPSTGLMTPQEVLDLRPIPIFIQYQ